MADSYIDAFETVIYGRLSCIAMRQAVLPLNSRWASAIEYCIEIQETHNARMEALIGRIKGLKIDEAEVAKVTDTFVRFGAWLNSLEGRPLDPAIFFGAEVPSVVGRERLPKLAGHLERMIKTLTPYAEAPDDERIEGSVGWLRQLRAAHEIAVRNRDAQRAAQKRQKDLGPEVENARAEWLDKYVANKSLIDGVLRHEKKLALKSFVFDDLAEVQRSRGVDDTDDDTGEDTGEDLEDLVTDPTGGPTPAPTPTDEEDGV
jgi:hypothetical protein